MFEAANLVAQDKDKVPDYCQVLRFKDSNGQVKEMIFPKALDLDRPKRPRTTFSESQLNILEKEFQKCQYLIGKDRTRLAETLALTETQIKVWFQNRRTKCKRDKAEADEKFPKIDELSQFSPDSKPKPAISPKTLLEEQKSDILPLSLSPLRPETTVKPLTPSPPMDPLVVPMTQPSFVMAPGFAAALYQNRLNNMTANLQTVQGPSNYSLGQPQGLMYPGFWALK